MKQLDYYVLDVFTGRRYEGNQLSVVHTDEELELQQYQNIASEFGYAETSFVHYSAEESIFKVRSFTPAGFEVGGAGHNLLGAVCLALLKKWEIFKNQPEEQGGDAKRQHDIHGIGECAQATGKSDPLRYKSNRRT